MYILRLSCIGMKVKRDISSLSWNKKECTVYTECTQMKNTAIASLSIKIIYGAKDAGIRDR
jgi:hypothetical protein